MNKGSQQTNPFMDAFPQRDNILNSNEKKIELVQNDQINVKKINPYQVKRTAVFRDESSIQKQDEYNHRITTGTVTPSSQAEKSKGEEELISPDLPNVLNRSAAISQTVTQP